MEGVQKLCAAGVDFIELNISCPNVKQGGLAFGIRAQGRRERWFPLCAKSALCR